MQDGDVIVHAFSASYQNTGEDGLIPDYDSLSTPSHPDRITHADTNAAPLFSLTGDSTLTIEGGSFTSNTKTIDLSDNAALTMTGGDITTAEPLLICADSELTGGTLHSSTDEPAVRVQPGVSATLGAEIRSEGAAAVGLEPGAGVTIDQASITVRAETPSGGAENYVDNFGNVVLGSGGEIVQTDAEPLTATPNAVFSKSRNLVSGTADAAPVIDTDTGAVTAPPQGSIHLANGLIAGGSDTVGASVTVDGDVDIPPAGTVTDQNGIKFTGSQAAPPAIETNGTVTVPLGGSITTQSGLRVEGSDSTPPSLNAEGKIIVPVGGSVTTGSGIIVQGSANEAPVLNELGGVTVPSGGSVTQGGSIIHMPLGGSVLGSEIHKNAIPATGVTLDQTALELTAGDSASLAATVTPADADDKTLVWSSSDPAVATVENGVVTAVASGSTVISATLAGNSDISATCAVTVTARSSGGGGSSSGGKTPPKTETTTKTEGGVTTETTTKTETRTDGAKVTETTVKAEDTRTGAATETKTTVVENSKAGVTTTSEIVTDHTGAATASVTSEAKADVTTANGVASATVGSQTVSKLIEQTKEAAKTAANESETVASTVTITADTGDAVKAVEVSLPAKAVTAAADLGAAVKVVSGAGEVAFDPASTAAVSQAAGADEMIRLEVRQAEPEALPEQAQPELSEAVVVELNLYVGSTKVTKFGGSVTVRIPYTPKTPGKAISVYYVAEDGARTLVPGARLTDGHVVFQTDHFSHYAIVEEGWQNPFADVRETDWFYEAVRYANVHALFSGVSDSAFDPHAPMTRAMLMTVLARLDGTDTTGGATWYEKGQAWAVRTGVSDGTAPASPITREQLAAMLYRYAQYKGYDTAASGDLAAFTDGGSGSAYAVPALRWAVGAGLLTGNGDGTLAPTASATRAETAALLMRFLESL